MGKHFQVDTNATLTTGLISYWEMEGNSNDFFSTNNGSDTAITYSSGNGKVNQGAGFNGSSSVISFTTVSALQPTSAFSVAFWLKTSTAATQGIFQSYSQATHASGLQIFQQASDNKLVLVAGNGAGSSNSETSASAVNDGNWHHYVCWFDGSNLKIYTDGSPGAAQSFSASLGYEATSYVRIGCANNTGTNFVFLNGNIDEVGFWSKALSSQEITDLYNGGSGQTMVNNTAFARSLSDSILTAASRSATLSRVATFKRNMTDAISNGASRLATVAKGLTRNISASILNGASRSATVSRLFGVVRALSDSILSGASRSATLSRLVSYFRSMADAISNAASRLATLAKGLARSLSDDIMNAEGRFAFVKIFTDGIISLFKSKYTTQGTTYGGKYAKQDTEFENKYQ
jgi:hypothetical protein